MKLQNLVTPQVFYDEEVVDYATLLAELGGFIDPTQINGQGNDRGTQASHQ